VRLSRLCLIALVALVFAGQVSAAPDVQLVRIRALAPEHGTAAGRVVLLAKVRYRPTRGLLIAAPNPTRTVDIGRLDLTVDGAHFHDSDQLVRTSARPLFYTHRIVLGPVLSAGARKLGRVRVSAHAAQIIHSGRTVFPVSLQEPRRFELPVRRVSRLPAPAPPVCEHAPVTAPFSRPTTITLVCMGEGVDFELVGGTKHGSVRLVGRTKQKAVLRYRPSAGYVGPDKIFFDASSSAGGRHSFSQGVLVGSIAVDVRPFELSAIGDSVTAGFGFLGNGAQWGALSLPSCIPPTPPNNRCSSNSPNGVGSTNPVGWLPDFGLANNVSWPAQFANEHAITGPDQYQNWAVSGSTPTDWASGYLNETLQQIAAGRPDLVVMTLGANPLLDTFLFGNGLQCVFAGTDAQLIACVQSFIDRVQLVPNLQSVLRQLLAAQGTRVVVSQYHLAIPASSLYTVHQLQVMFGVVNGNIATAVQGVTGYGTRLFLMTPPRFDVGIGPGSYVCEGQIYNSMVDGPSNQATVSQTFLQVLYPLTFCSGAPWIIYADSGIHPNAAGYAQFRQALDQVVAQNGLLPTVLENR
jgi:lysophospholipase L1-like esterase